MPTPSTDWKETIPPGEDALFETYAAALGDIQRKAGAGRKTNRALHGKGAGAVAELTVLPDLPPHARQGLFATPATYGAYVRYSNGAGRAQSDGKPDVRGIALKVLGVDGKKVIPGMENARTQDFLLIRTPAIPFKDAHEFVKVVTAASGSPLLLLPRVIGRLGFARTFQLLPQIQKGLATPMTSLASTRYFSAAPVRCGDYAVHYTLRPLAPSEPAERGTSPDALADALSTRLNAGPVVYDFQLQFYVDPEKTPIEDASVEWREEDAPFVTVARLTLPQQDRESASGKRVSEVVEGLSFDTWHALEAHRPLGNIMRARNQAYRVSTLGRKAAPEPEGDETVA